MHRHGSALSRLRAVLMSTAPDPHSLVPQCLDYAPILVPTAVLWIKTNLDPATVCTDLAMCSAEAARSLHSSILKVISAHKSPPYVVSSASLWMSLTR